MNRFICYIKIIQNKGNIFLQGLFFLQENVCAYRFEKGVFMEKSYWEKSCKYSIRKLTVGTASVFLATQNVAADGIEVKEK